MLKIILFIAAIYAIRLYFYFKKEEKHEKLYPKNWKEIRQKILERAGNKCEMCICNVCDKYDAIIAKIDGALKEDANK